MTNQPIIAEVVFDLPLEGGFDYLCPPQAQVGMRVKANLNNRREIGVITKIIPESQFKSLKSISLLCDAQPIFKDSDLRLAEAMAQMCGCTKGQALMAMLPDALRKGKSLNTPRTETGPVQVHKQTANRSRLGTGHALVYEPGGQFDFGLLKEQIDAILSDNHSVLMVVADHNALSRVGNWVKKFWEKQSVIAKSQMKSSEEMAQWLKLNGAFNGIVVGMRSSVFEPLNNIGLAVLVDDMNTSFHQEQTPMYHARDVLLMRAKFQEFPVHIYSTTPSLLCWHMAQQGTLRLIHSKTAPKALRIVDTSNYKYLGKALMSPPVRDAINAAMIKKTKTLLIFNRRGFYNRTVCTQCQGVLCCKRCQSPMVFDDEKRLYQCRYCKTTESAQVMCAKCRSSSWKSHGFGVQAITKAIKEYFPQAKVLWFEKGDEGTMEGYDICVATQAIERFNGHKLFENAVFLDFDSELSRAHLNAGMNALRFARMVATMAQTVFIQTVNMKHSVVDALSKSDDRIAYDAELAMRKELDLPPYKTMVCLNVRSVTQKVSEQSAMDMYNALIKVKRNGFTIAKPVPAAVMQKRGQFRYEIVVHGPAPQWATVHWIKEALKGIKRLSKAIVTMDVTL